MLRKLVLSIGVLIIIQYSSGQTTLFDKTRVSSIYIEIPADSLNQIMTDVLSDHYFKARFIYDYDSGRDTLEDIGFRLRGNTSRFSNKKSFKLSFNEYVPGRRYQEVKKINLNGQHNDPTMVREKLFYDVWKKAGMVERRSSFVRLYINNTYYGLYTNLEEYDKDWLQRVYGENEGNLYKCTYPADLAYHGPDQQTYKDIGSGSATGGRAYDLQTNEASDDYSDLVELMRVLTLAEDAQFIARISDELNVDEVLKAFALDVATGNWDDYMYDMNNYFLYHNMNTGKFEFITYDTDNTFGVDWMNQDWATRNCLDWYDHSQPRPLISRLMAIPAYKAKYEQFLDTIARYIIDPDSIFDHIDNMRNLITAAATNDTYRTLDYGYTIYDFYNGFIQTVDNHTPYGIKPFLTLRTSKILEQIHPAAIQEPSSTTDLFTIFPNPAKDVIQVFTQEHPDPLLVRINNSMGKLCQGFEQAPGEQTSLINLSNLPAGLYTVTINLQGRSITKKLIKL